jgi:hypothetical protein
MIVTHVQRKSVWLFPEHLFVPNLLLQSLPSSAPDSERMGSIAGEECRVPCVYLMWWIVSYGDNNVVMIEAMCFRSLFALRLC